MAASRILATALALVSLAACSGPASPPLAPISTTPVTVTVTAPAASSGATPQASVTPASPSTESSPAPESPAASPSPAASTPAPSTPQRPSPASPTTVYFDAYPTQYKFAIVHAIVNVAGTLAVVVDPVTMCNQASTDDACKAAVDGEEYVILNQSLRTYTVPFAPGATAKYLRSGMPDDYRTEAPKVRTWASSQRTVFVIASNGKTVSNITEWWHP